MSEILILIAKFAEDVMWFVNLLESLTPEQRSLIIQKFKAILP